MSPMRTLDLPLPGGREGATVRLHPLLTGEILAPPGLLERPPGPLGLLRALGVGVPKSEWSWIPVPAFLVEHPEAGPLLVDTGLHPEAQLDPKATMGATATRLYDFRVDPEHTLEAQLEARGVAPEDLRLIVMTHLHTDHASGVPRFPDATLAVSDDEWRVAHRPGRILRGYERIHIPEAFDWRLVRHTTPLPPFARGADLFGDGSVRLLATPGHTVGHQSVLLRLREHEALLTGDAAYTRTAIERSVIPGMFQDRKASRDSLRRIQEFIEQSPDALVIPGHDAPTWAKLERAYE
jgi:N-acyl homoserine lactone hydrolase